MSFYGIGQGPRMRYILRKVEKNERIKFKDIKITYDAYYRYGFEGLK